MNIATIRLMSKVLFMPTDITVLLPENPAGENEKLPVVWLLHGANGDHRTYLYDVDFDAILKKHRCVIVMPSALNSDYGNYPDFGTGYRFADYFFEELIPFIRGTFPVSEKREDNYIEGASMGGYGAMMLGLMHPEMFAAIGILGASLRESAFLAPYEKELSEIFKKDALANPKAFPTEYGPPWLGIKRKEVNVITKYPTIREFLDSPECMWRRFPEVAEKGLLPKIYAACGSEDLFYETNLNFQKLVQKLGLENHVYFDFPKGIGHDSEYFARQIGLFLDYCNV